MKAQFIASIAALATLSACSYIEAKLSPPPPTEPLPPAACAGLAAAINRELAVIAAAHVMDKPGGLDLRMAGVHANLLLMGQNKCPPLQAPIIPHSYPRDKALDCYRVYVLGPAEEVPRRCDRSTW